MNDRDHNQTNQPGTDNPKQGNQPGKDNQPDKRKEKGKQHSDPKR